MKIGLQIVSIEVYLTGFFFGVLSAFKERIRSNLAMIRDQSRPNWMAIESKHGGDKAFYAIVKTHKHRSNKIYNYELTVRKKKAHERERRKQSGLIRRLHAGYIEKK